MQEGAHAATEVEDIMDCIPHKCFICSLFLCSRVKFLAHSMMRLLILMFWVAAALGMSLGIKGNKGAVSSLFNFLITPSYFCNSFTRNPATCFAF
jgi:hypothetical protein